MAVTTKCPQCNTVFRVSAEQLRAAGGWVRCGRCATEFNAVAKLTDSKEDQAAAINLDDGPRPEQQLKDLLVAGDRTGNADRRGHAGRTGWLLGIVALAAVLAGQYVWNARDALALDPDTRPWVERFCELTGCSLEVYRNLNALDLGNRDIRTDPERRGVLLVNAMVTSHAPIAQAFPTLQLDFKNSAGELVARRRFAAPICFGEQAEAGNGMAPQVPYHVRLELLMPDEDAVNFGFTFL